VSAAFDRSKIVASSLKEQTAVKNMPLQIENSSFAQSMWCREDDVGTIQCDLDDLENLLPS
jgi:hypothetical protein